MREGDLFLLKISVDSPQAGSYFVCCHTPATTVPEAGLADKTHPENPDEGDGAGGAGDAPSTAGVSTFAALAGYLPGDDTGSMAATACTCGTLATSYYMCCRADPKKQAEEEALAEANKQAEEAKVKQELEEAAQKAKEAADKKAAENTAKPPSSLPPPGTPGPIPENIKAALQLIPDALLEQLHHAEDGKDEPLLLQLLSNKPFISDYVENLVRVADEVSCVIRTGSFSFHFFILDSSCCATDGPMYHVGQTHAVARTDDGLNR